MIEFQIKPLYFGISMYKEKNWPHEKNECDAESLIEHKIENHLFIY